MAGARAVDDRAGEESGSFLKKSNKKFLPDWLEAWFTTGYYGIKIFSLLFLQKKKTLACFPLRPGGDGPPGVRLVYRSA